MVSANYDVDNTGA